MDNSSRPPEADDTSQHVAISLLLIGLFLEACFHLQYHQDTSLKCSACLHNPRLADSSPTFTSA